MKHTLALALGFAVAACSFNAAADGAGAFIRAEAGNSNLEVNGNDANDTVLSIRGGYFFNANIGVEGFYSQLGEDADNGASVEADSYGIGIVAKKNFSDAAHTGGFISGRAGVAKTTVDTAISGFFSLSDEDTVPYIGIGGGYDFSPNFGISGNIDYQNADVYGTDFKFVTTAVAIEYRF
jgi:OmpA-OmpF porin, OOP family